MGLSGKVDVNRKDFGLVWNAALETGGVLVSENVTLTFEVSAIKQADAEAPAESVVESTESEVVAEPTVEASEKGGLVGWVKNLFATSTR